MKPLGKDDHLNVTRTRVPIWNPSFVKSNLPRVCRNSSDTTKVSRCEDEQIKELCHTNYEKAAKSGASGSDELSAPRLLRGVDPLHKYLGRAFRHALDIGKFVNLSNVLL